MDNLDIIFCSIPYSNLDHVYSAPAILKGVVTTNGYTSKTKDFGIDLLKLCNNDINLFNRVQSYFLDLDNNLSDEEQTILDKFYNGAIDFFKNNPSKFIGISIISFYTHKPAVELLCRLKKSGINSKIIVGGRGSKVATSNVVNSILKISKLDKMIEFGNFLKKKKLADYIVIGDGEDAILDILQGQKTKTNYASDSFSYPLPDYSDYNFDDYLKSNNGDQVMFPITGSKGCVRNCDFCDIRFQFGRYKHRDGSDIAKEMIYIAENLGFRKFQFTDSLVNGGLKILEEFCTIIAEYNDNNPDNKISWNGQYICRPSDQMPERLYPLMARSGAHGLTIGVESGSDHVLEHMNKKTNNDALFYELTQFQKNNITCVLLTFVGHWAETYDDFVNHCRMIVNLLPFIRSGTVSALSLGILALILDGTPSMDEVRAGDIILSDFKNDLIWYAKNNPANTFKERLYRRLILHKLATELKIPILEEWNYLNSLNVIVKHHSNEINEFYEKCTRSI